jgi:hypothetical protein
MGDHSHIIELIDQTLEETADRRGELVRTLMNSQAGYLIDWIGFRLSGNQEPCLMLDPFDSYKEKIRKYLQGIELDEPPEHGLPTDEPDNAHRKYQ